MIQMRVHQKRHQNMEKIQKNSHYSHNLKPAINSRDNQNPHFFSERYMVLITFNHPPDIIEKYNGFQATAKEGKGNFLTKNQ